LIPTLNAVDLRHWQEFFGQFDQGIGTDFDAVAAVGGADGSIRVFAIRLNEAPLLIRTWFLRGQPISSLSLAIDKRSLEAATLGRSGGQTLNGLVLLACDGTGPPLLREILSNQEVRPANKEEVAESLPKPWERENKAVFGVLFYEDENLWVIVRVKVKFDNDPDLLLAFAKRILNGSNQFRVVNKLEDDNAADVTKLELQQMPRSRALVLAVVGIAAGSSVWRLYRRDDDGLITRLKRDENEGKITIIDAAIAPFPLLPDPVLDEPMQRFLVAARSNGALRTWVQAKPKVQQATWDEKRPDGAPPVIDRPARVAAATTGRACVPLVACRGPSGGTGYTWAADLGAVGPNWPEAIGTLEDEVPIALVGLHGAPHLAVARPSDVTVWDLDRNRLVTRIGLDQRTVALDAGVDLDRLWLLIASETRNEERLWNLLNAESGVASLIEELKGASKSSDARFAVLAEGLKIVTAAVAVNGENQQILTITLRTVRDDTPPSRVDTFTVPLSVNHPETKALRLVDVAVIGSETWVLLVLNDKPSVVHLSKLAICDLNIEGQDLRAAVFDLDPDDENKSLPIVWTIDKDWLRITAWSFSDPANGQLSALVRAQKSFKKDGKLTELDPVTTNSATAIVVRVDGHKRLIGAAPELVTVWDLEAKDLVRSDALERGGPLVSTAVEAVVTADKEQKCLRIWDQATGRLRNRLHAPKDSNWPNSLGFLAALPTPARPRLVLGGEAGLAVIDLRSSRVVASTPPGLSISGLAAEVDAEGNAFIASVVKETNEPQVARVWSKPFNEEADLFNTPLPDLSHLQDGNSNDVRAVALQRLGDRLLAATVSETTLLVHDLPQGTAALGVGKSNDPFKLTNLGSAKALHLAAPLENDASGVLVAVGGASQFALLDVPLRAIGKDSPDRPATTWTIEAEEPAHVVAALGGIEGPRLVAGLQAFRSRPLLRIDGSKPPLFDLPIQLLSASNAFLQGRITPTRRLDLQIQTDSPQALGWSEHGPRKLTARAALVQGAYSCFLIDTIDRTDLRIAGALVVWDGIEVNDPGVGGLLLLDDIHLSATATVELPGVQGGINATGPRVRLRAMSFGPDAEWLAKLPRREVLSWTLASNPGSSVACEWHLAEAVLDANKSGPLIARGHLISEGGVSIQGDFAIDLKRTEDRFAPESYTLKVPPHVYAAEQVTFPDLSNADTTRDDVVYPSARNGPVGLAFDLVEARSPEGGPTGGRVHLVTPAVKNGQVRLFPFDPQQVPFDPGASAAAAQPLPRVSPTVPLLVHREAHGGRLRGRWPDRAEPVDLPSQRGTELTTDPGSTWLLAPLARTPRGVASLTSTILVRPGGRPLEWTLLQTEVLLSAQRDGGALFDAQPNGVASAGPSLISILAGTVRRSASAAGSRPFVLFDDKTIQTKVLKTGNTGVLAVRSIDARGRSSYRFINSPYYSLIPQVTNLPKTGSNQLEVNEFSPSPEVADPRLLSPAEVHALKVKGGSRYQPADPGRDRPEGRAFQLIPSQDSQESANPIVRLAEVAAVRASEYPDAPLSADFPTSPDVKTFLPHDLELGFGLGKPGALFHQVVQCLDSPAREDPQAVKRVVSLPTGLARREPQRFLPPIQSLLRIDEKSTKIVRLADSGLIQLTVAWEEIVGAVDVRKAEFSDKLELEEVDGNQEARKLKDREKAVLWVERVGEQIRALPRTVAERASVEVRVPLSPFRTGRPVDAFDLFLVTRADMKIASDDTTLSPMLVAINSNIPPDDQLLNARRFDELMEKVETPQDDWFGWSVWRLKRQPDGQPMLLSWINQLSNTKDLYLNILWLSEASNRTGKAYKNAPSLDELKLRDVPHEPQSPRLAAVLRLPSSTGNGLLAGTREITLFDGPSATTKGVRPQVEPEGERAWIRFTAKDSEVLNTQDPFPAERPLDLTCGLFVIKIYEDGATLLAQIEAAPEDLHGGLLKRSLPEIHLDESDLSRPASQIRLDLAPERLRIERNRSNVKRSNPIGPKALIPFKLMVRRLQPAQVSNSRSRVLQFITVVSLTAVIVYWSYHPLSAPLQEGLSGNIATILAGFTVVSGLIERSTEVIVGIFRPLNSEFEEELTQIERDLGKNTPEYQEKLKQFLIYKNGTKQLSLLAGFTMAVLLCSAGVGILKSILNLSGAGFAQAQFIRGVDIILTSGLLAGFSQALHENLANSIRAAVDSFKKPS
jgi:hypothetical protein